MLLSKCNVQNKYSNQDTLNMKKIKFTFVIIVSFIITSCGFHLRGNQDLSDVLPELSLQGTSKHSELGRELSRALTEAKINVSDGSATVFKVNNDTFSKRVLSLDSAGRANQYELSYNLSFSLFKTVANQKAKTAKESLVRLVDLIPAQSITVKREYLFDANLVLAEADEERRFKSDMLQEAMLQVTRRLNFSLRSRKKPDPEKTLKPQLKVNDVESKNK